MTQKERCNSGEDALQDLLEESNRKKEFGGYKVKGRDTLEKTVRG